jgi:hypothetical protein
LGRFAPLIASIGGENAQAPEKLDENLGLSGSPACSS